LVIELTDEDELGFRYADADALLYLMVDRRWSQSELVDAGFPSEFVADIAERVRRNHYKRRVPVIAKLSNRTVDRDFRYARDWGT
jgi:NAD+ synthase